MISFVVIAHNEARNIGACLEAIAAQHSLSEFEVVVVDDGSTDRTADVVRALQVHRPWLRLVEQENKGRGAARAAGVVAARGDVIAFVDGDVRVPPRWLATCLAGLERFDVVGGTPVPDGDVSYVSRRFGLVPREAPAAATVTGSNGLYRRAALDEVPFDSRLRDGEDVDINRRLIAGGYRLACLPGLLVEHREDKTWRQSIAWLYQSGQGATRQLVNHREIRRPDVAFFGALACLALALLLTPRLSVRPPGLAPARPARAHRWRGVAPTIAYLLVVSERHLRAKFVSRGGAVYRARYVAAVVVHSCLLAAYFAGRGHGLLGLISARLRRHPNGAG
ncbi:MAG TPA: glycosyltransferase [Acidimicrobiales bacterium]|nr:glycosyltransferase [Acidimicrobiales bacterium]